MPHVGYRHSDEAKAKISASCRGYRRPQEVAARIVAGIRATAARKRGGISVQENQVLFNRAYHLRHRERLLKRMKDRYKRMRDEYLARARSSRLKREYGLKDDQYDAVLAAQNGRCAICQRLPTRRRLAVDHCHSIRRVRGLLCQKCNLGLGAFNDDIYLLLRAVSYLSAGVEKIA